MSLAGSRFGVRGRGGESLHGEARCITANSHMGSPLPSRMTDTTENITDYNQVEWQLVDVIKLQR